MQMTEAVDAPRPGRVRTAHKWSAGSVLMVGGGRGMVGAAVMAGRSALHFGAGAVGVAGPDPDMAQVLAPELLAFRTSDLPDRFDVAVVGPGMGDRSDLTLNALAGRGAVVVDADALGHLPSDHRFTNRAVLTPHAGEFRGMTGDEPSPGAARRLATRMRAVVLLKGNPTFVTDGGPPWVVDSGGVELATIGSGDVLSGMIGALLARGLEPLEAARSAAYWHGVAASDLRSSGTVTADRLSTHIGRFAWSDG
jgi:NAD(P)H-hydrate epimerase